MSKGRRALKVVGWWFAVLGGLTVVFIFGFIPYFVAYIFTANRFHFPDPNDGKTPQSYGMTYRAVEFKSRDGVDLKGWYLPADGQAAGTIVYCHGQNRTRIEMLPMAQYAHSLGYNGLVFDLRHQGASSGDMSSVGYWERLDAEAALRYAADEEHAAQPEILWGVSMGAAAGLLAAAETPNVAGVISDSSFLSFDDTAHHHWKILTGWPQFPFVYEIEPQVAWRAHFKISDFDLEKAVRAINPRPILFVGVEGDKRMPPDIARKLDADSTSPGKMLVIVPGTRHGEGFNSGNAQYEQAVKDFLARIKPGG